MSNVISLDEKRAEQATYEAPMLIVTAADYHFGITEHGGTNFAIVMRKDGQGFGLAMTESEARQFAREIVDTANVMRQQRIQAEKGTPA